MTHTVLMETLSHFYFGMRSQVMPTFCTKIHMYSHNHSIPLFQGCAMSKIIKTRYGDRIQVGQVFSVRSPARRVPAARGLCDQHDNFAEHGNARSFPVTRSRITSSTGAVSLLLSARSEARCSPRSQFHGEPLWSPGSSRPSACPPCTHRLRTAWVTRDFGLGIPRAGDPVPFCLDTRPTETAGWCVFHTGGVCGHSLSSST